MRASWSNVSTVLGHSEMDALVDLYRYDLEFLSYRPYELSTSTLATSFSGLGQALGQRSITLILTARGSPFLPTKASGSLILIVVNASVQRTASMTRFSTQP
jgi:hypothetical protein